MVALATVLVSANTSQIAIAIVTSYFRPVVVCYSCMMLTKIVHSNQSALTYDPQLSTGETVIPLQIHLLYKICHLHTANILRLLHSLNNSECMHFVVQA